MTDEEMGAYDCPVCGYYCLGNGGFGCIDKPFLLKGQNMSMPILCIDFDGVLHSYTSGWKGPRCIPDGPIPGAIEWLDSLVEDGDAVCAMAPRFRDFDVCIFSSRNRYWGGKAAMKNWLIKHGFPKHKIENIRFPLFKPAAFLMIDDRCLKFTGVFPTTEEMKRFRTWQL